MSEEVNAPAPTQAVQVSDFDDLPIHASTRAVQRREAVVAFCRDQLKYGIHYDVLPAEKWKCKDKSTAQIMGDKDIKKFFTQAGADMLTLSWSIRPEFKTITETTDYQKPFFYYKVRCTLFSPNGHALTSAEAVCSSEESGFKVRWLQAREIQDHPDLRNTNLDTLRKKVFGYGDYAKTKYAVVNPELGDQAHNVYSKAQKRAKVAAVRQLFAIGDLFNQPVEDWVDGQHVEEQEVPEAPAPPPQRPAAKEKAPDSGNTPKKILDLQRLFSDRCKKHGITEKADLDEQLGNMWGDTELVSWKDVTSADRARRVEDWINRSLPADGPRPGKMF